MNQAMNQNEKYQISCQDIKLSQKNFGLTEDQFNKYIIRARAGETSVLSIIYVRHFEVCKTYLVNNLKLNEEDAVDAFMEAIELFWNKISCGKVKYGNLAFLFTKMAIQIYIKSKVHAKKLDCSQLRNLLQTNNFDYCEQCAVEAMSLLNDVERNLILSHYVHDITLIEYANNATINETTIRKRKQRAVEHFRREFFRIFKPDP